MLMFGLGGTLVEVFQDVVFRMPPISRDQAGEMIGSGLFSATCPPSPSASAMRSA